MIILSSLLHLLVIYTRCIDIIHFKCLGVFIKRLFKNIVQERRENNHKIILLKIKIKEINTYYSIYIFYLLISIYFYFIYIKKKNLNNYLMLIYGNNTSIIRQ